MHYVAFMRGVAPSTPPRNNANIVAALSTMGFSQVTPVLSSGNYVFATDPADDGDLAARIEAVLLERLGVPVMTIVRRQDEVQALVDENPLAGVPHGPASYQLVTFFRHLVDIGFDLPYQPPGKSFKLVACVDGALFTVADNRPGQPGGSGHTIDLMAWLEKQYTKDLTSRTPPTLQKILKKMADLP